MNIHDRPLAGAGLTSYRYKGAYGWIMIGATNHHEALKEALRSMSYGGADMARLQVWDALAGCYVPAVQSKATHFYSYKIQTDNRGLVTGRVQVERDYSPAEVLALALSMSNVPFVNPRIVECKQS